MELKKEMVMLKDGTICTLRSPNKYDVENFIQYLKTTSEETYFMARYPEEVNININKQIEKLYDELYKEGNNDY